MRPETEIQDRIRDLLTFEFEHRVEVASEKAPIKCVHNYRHPLDTRKQIEGEANVDYNRISLPVAQTIGLCMYGADDPTQWAGTICEDLIDAQRCPLFSPKETPEAIRTAIEGQIRDPAWVKENLPAVEALLWVINGEKLPEPKERPSEPPAVLANEPSLEHWVENLPPWKRWVLRALGIGPSSSLRLPPSAKEE